MTVENGLSLPFNDPVEAAWLAAVLDDREKTIYDIITQLEPELFEQEYIIAEACQAELRSGDRKGQPCEKPGKVVRGGLSYCGTHDPDPKAALDGKIISPDMAMRIEGMRGAAAPHSASESRSSMLRPSERISLTSTLKLSGMPASKLSSPLTIDS